MKFENKISRRQFVRLTGVAALGGATLAACAAPAARPSAPAAGTTPAAPAAGAQPTDAAPVAAGAGALTVWGSGLDITQIEKDPTGKGASQKAHKDAFLAKHPGTNVIWEDHGWDEALRQNVVTAMLGGTQPDVIVGENFFQQYASLNALLPIDDVLTPEVLDNSIVGTHKAAIYNGKHYGLSWISGCFGFEGNPNVLKDAGVEPKIPGTWDELLAAAETVNKGGKAAGYTLQGPLGFSVGGMFRLAVYMQQSGVQLVKADDPFAPNFDDPKSFPVWEFVRKINAFTPPGLTFEADEGKVYSQLWAGKSAYQMAGSWHVNGAKEAGLKNAIYGPVPIPQGGKQASYVVGNVIYGALSATKVPELALDWVIASQDASVQSKIAKGDGRLPSTKKAIDELLKDSTMDDATKQFATLLRDSDLGILPQWRKEPNKLNAVWNDLFTAVLTTQTDVASLAADAQKKAVEIVTAA